MSPSVQYGPERPRSTTAPQPSLPAELSAVREALEAALPEALRQHEARMRVLAQGLVASQQSAELTMAKRSIGHWRKAAVTFGLVAGAAASSCATRLLAGTELTAAATAVAEQSADEAAREAAATVASAHEDTRSLAIANTGRIEALEGKIDLVLLLLQKADARGEGEPATPATPKRGRR